VASGSTGIIRYGVCLENPLGSGVTITQLTIGYTGKQWRNGGNVAQHALTFAQQVFSGAPNLTTGTFTDVASLSFTGPIATATASALDGNLPANRMAIGGNLNVNIPAGSRIVLRWEDLNDAGNDHGLAIDDLSVSVTASSAASLSLSVNSLSLSEGNAGTTNFGFTVSMTGGVAPVGGISFTAQTADGTANAGTDYIAVNGPFTIAEGQSSTTVTVQVVGETVPEGNETFSLTISNPSGGATIASGGGTGTGTILNNDIATVTISSIQGSSTQSPFVGQTVATTGIVTYVTNNGYFIQDPIGDANLMTSEGILVFTGTSGAKPNVGDRVLVSGQLKNSVPQRIRIRRASIPLD